MSQRPVGDEQRFHVGEVKASHEPFYHFIPDECLIPPLDDGLLFGPHERKSCGSEGSVAD